MKIFEIFLATGIKNPQTGIIESLKQDETKTLKFTITEQTKEMIGRQHKNREIKIGKNQINPPIGTTSLKRSKFLIIDCNYPINLRIGKNK